MISFTPITHGHAIKSLRTAGFRVTEASYPAAYTIPRHGHESASLTFVLSGSVREDVQGSTESLSRRQLLLKPAGLTHSNNFGHNGARLLLVEVFERSDYTRNALNRAFARATRITSPHATTPLLRVSDELHRHDSYSALCIEGLLLELVAELGRSEAGSGCSAEPAYVRRTRDRLHAGMNASIRLSDLAAAEGIEASRLARAFRRRYGCSIAAYSRKLRLEQAMRALTHTEASIGTIAALTGFADQSHLTRELRRLTGMTPRAYREQTRHR